MAGVLKVRDSDGTLRTVTALKARDSDGTLRTIISAKVRDADGTLREFFTAGGGPGPSNPCFINPGSWFAQGKPTVGFHVFSAFAQAPAPPPTSYLWSVVDGNGYINGPANQPTATLAVISPGQSEGETVTFACDMVVAGVQWQALCTFNYVSTV